MIFLRTQYNYDSDAVSRETASVFDGESKTQQCFKSECDINTIMRRFGVSGQLPPVSVPPKFGDFTSVTDYHSALNAVAQAGEVFDSLDASIRARFGNDPSQLLRFLDDNSNRAEAVKLGLVLPSLEAGGGMGAAPHVDGATVSTSGVVS